MDNRRQFARVDHEILASYSHYDPEEVKDDEGMAKTLNLSVSGLLLQLPRAVEVEQKLQLALNLDGQVVELVGRVVRCEAADAGDMHDVGVELVHVPDPFVQVVERYFSTSS